MKLTAELFNGTHSYNQIAEMTNKSKQEVIKYATQYGLRECDKDKEEVQKQTHHAYFWNNPFNLIG